MSATERSGAARESREGYYGRSGRTPTTKAFVSSLLEMGNGNPLLTWVNCGLCVDERGAGNVVDGVKRGSPADFLKMAQESNNTLIIPTK